MNYKWIISQWWMNFIHCGWNPSMLTLPMMLVMVMLVDVGVHNNKYVFEKKKY